MSQKLIVGHEVSGTVTVLDVLKNQAPIKFSYLDIENHHAKDAIITVTEANYLKVLMKQLLLQIKPLRADKLPLY